MTTTSTAVNSAPAPAASSTPRRPVRTRLIVTAGAYCGSCGAAYGYGCC